MLNIEIFTCKYDSEQLSSLKKKVQEAVSYAVYEEVNKAKAVSAKDLDLYFDIEIDEREIYYFNNNLIIKANVSNSSAMVLFRLTCFCSRKETNERIELTDSFDDITIDVIFSFHSNWQITATIDETIPICISTPGVSYKCLFYPSNEGVLKLFFSKQIDNMDCDKLESALSGTIDEYNKNNERPIAFFQRLGKNKNKRKQLWFQIDFGGAEERAVNAVLGAFRGFDFIKKVIIK